MRVKNRVDTEKIARRDYSQMMQPTRLPMFEEFTWDFLKLARAYLAPNTIEIHKRGIATFLSQIGNRRIDLYSMKDIEKFKLDRVSRVSPTTVNIEFRVLKTLFQTAVR